MREFLGDRWSTEIHNDKASKASKRFDGFGVVTILWSLKVKDDWQILCFSELGRDCLQDFQATSAKTSEEQHPTLRHRVENITQLLVIKQEVDKLSHLQIIDGDSLGMLFGHGLAPPRFERKAEALKSAIRDPKGWQRIRLKVVGPHAEVAVNDVVVTISEAIKAPEGHIGLQGENGHFEWRELRIREFPAR